jgi:hypothetical protein
MKLGPLLQERSPGAEAALVVAAPIVVGAIAGLLAAESKAGYVILSLLAAVGIFLGGMEHRTWVEGAYRGLFAGLLYGVSLLTVLELREKAPKVDLPDHLILVAVISAVVSVILAAIGGAVRGRAERRSVGAGRPPGRP